MLQVFDQDSALMCARHHPAKPRSIRVLHWAVTVLISAALASGYYAFDFSWTADGFFSRDLLFIVHRSSGLLAAVLILVWFTLRIPSLRRHCGAAGWNRVIAIGHIAIAVMGFAIPVLGWIGRSLGGRSAEMFSLLPAHNLVAKGEGAHVYMVFELHKALIPWFLLLVGLHIAATLVHTFLLRDNLLVSMLSNRLNRKGK